MNVGFTGTQQGMSDEQHLPEALSSSERELYGMEVRER